MNGPGNATTAAGPWGNYNCDTPLPVLQDLLNYIAKMNPQPDFIVCKYDTFHHIMSNVTSYQLHHLSYRFMLYQLLYVIMSSFMLRHVYIIRIASTWISLFMLVCRYW